MYGAKRLINRRRCSSIDYLSFDAFALASEKRRINYGENRENHARSAYTIGAEKVLERRSDARKSESNLRRFFLWLSSLVILFDFDAIFRND